MDNQPPTQQPQNTNEYSAQPPQQQSYAQPQQYAEPTYAQNEPMPAVVTPPRRHSKVKKFFLWLLVLLLIAGAGAGAGAYYYQQQKLDSAAKDKATLESKAESLQQQLTASQATAKKSGKSTVTAASATQVLNGQINTTKTAGKVTVQTLFVPGQVTEIWLEYGSSPTSFTKATAHASNGLEQSSGGDYAVHEWQINNDQFLAGSTYYYRSAAKAKGTTVYSAPTAFVTP
jgi:hypothetical protein